MGLKAQHCNIKEYWKKYIKMSWVWCEMQHIWKIFRSITTGWPTEAELRQKEKIIEKTQLIYMQV